MLAILKIMAWSERHTYTPQKDASDLFQVLANYLNDANSKRLYEVGAHLLQMEDFNYEAAGAWLAGHVETFERISGRHELRAELIH